jgi:hypothetical protein
LSDQDVDRDAIVIPEFEAQFEAAKSRGADADEMQSLTEDYEAARRDEYNRRNQVSDTSSTEIDSSDSPTPRDDPTAPQTADQTDDTTPGDTDTPATDPNADTQNDPNAAPAQTGV